MPSEEDGGRAATHKKEAKEVKSEGRRIRQKKWDQEKRKKSIAIGASWRHVGLLPLLPLTHPKDMQSGARPYVSESGKEIQQGRAARKDSIVDFLQFGN